MIKQLIVDGKMTDILFNSKESMDGLLGWVKDNINYFLAKVYISNNDDLVFKVKKNTINIICNDIKVEIKVHEVLLKKGNKECINDISDRDKLFREAAKIIVTAQQGSASLLQRKLKVGYNRASRLIDQFEAAGIVGGFTGSWYRQVLVPNLLALDRLLEN
jgi:DNA segregation ATPase FtsK/SpoIIIE-like protein